MDMNEWPSTLSVQPNKSVLPFAQEASIPQIQGIILLRQKEISCLYSLNQ